MIGANPRWKAEINPGRDRQANPLPRRDRQPPRHYKINKGEGRAMRIEKVTRAMENRGRAQRKEGKKMEERERNQAK